jgi:hypothetical protein
VHETRKNSGFFVAIRQSSGDRSFSVLISHIK